MSRRWGAGEPWIIKKAVCLHEEDHGLLWKHVEYRTGHSESRRSRRLVLSFIATVANYEYSFNWYFYQVSMHFTVFMCTSFTGNFITTSSTGVYEFLFQ